MDLATFFNELAQANLSIREYTYFFVAVTSIGGWSEEALKATYRVGLPTRRWQESPGIEGYTWWEYVDLILSTFAADEPPLSIPGVLSTGINTSTLPAWSAPEPNEEDSGKTVANSSSKYLSPSSVGKRPSSRLPQHRRKKRKEMDDILAETNQPKQNAYIIKLFDRSVDLAQFGTTIPLYPICRTWMRNNPAVQEKNSPSPPHISGEDEMTDTLNDKGQNVSRLPPPVSCSVNSAGEPVNLGIPSVEKPAESQSLETAVGASPLIFSHIKRWKNIRQKWKEASSKNQLRYSESIKILKEMYER
ncbi:protein lin-37 homolog [Xyrauchen texanus]|uniref:protein lin-37 homolog n=1 Tax=Xyrauchen texanus TaxID=154827 RepID=UPI00224193E9|nr:protein lin-37 homolog [Xyrauchen texanus]